MRRWFKNDYGDPFELTDEQADIFNTVWLKQFPRNQVIASTQYGKSSVVAMALVLRSQTFHEQWANVSGSKPKAQIIMEKVIQHTFDHERFLSQLALDNNENLDRLRRERSKDHLTWLGGGGVRTYGAETRSQKKVIESLIGFGCPNIVEDEAALIPDNFQAMIMRMLGGHRDNFLLKISNPFTRGHFYRTWNNSKYYRLFIDYKQAIAEGRYTEDFIDEMRDEPMFDILYKCEFPPEDEIDMDGYRGMFTQQMLTEAQTTEIDRSGWKKLGCDIAGGGDYNVYVIRGEHGAWVEGYNKSKDTMVNVTEIERIQEKYPEIKDEDVYIDDIGIGRGVSDRGKEKGRGWNGVNVGDKVKNESFANLKAESYWNTKIWLDKGGKLYPDNKWQQLLHIRYKINTDKCLQIISKEKLRERGIKSPDFAEALMLTHVNANTAAQAITNFYSGLMGQETPSDNLEKLKRMAQGIQ